MSSSPLPSVERTKHLTYSILFALVIVGAPLGLSACMASGELVASYPVVEVQTVPVQIESYPRYAYAGSYAYLVDDRWYYRSRGRWVVFREEPRELRTYRVEHARRNPRPVYSAPPAHRRRDR